MPSEQGVTIGDLQEKLKYIDLDLTDIPDFFKHQESLNYRASKSYDEKKYKVYKYVEVADIDILMTPTNRLDELSLKYKSAESIYSYLEPQGEEDIEKHALFLKMLEGLDEESIASLEEEQKTILKKIPFEVKYHNNFLWQVYYSEYADRYFMMVPTKESENSALFYLIKQKIEFEKSNRANKSNLIFLPICYEDYTEEYLKKAEIVDIENYLWLYTNDWPSVYEVFDKKGNLSIQIVGKTNVYEGIESKYKIVLKTKEEAIEFYKLVKALFILSTTTSVEYKFRAKVSASGGLDFYYGTKKLTYDMLSDFISKELEIKLSDINEEIKTIDEYNGTLFKLKKIAQMQTEEYLEKQKQIVTYLECKKTFFGRVKFFFNKTGYKPSLKGKLEVSDSRKARKSIEKEEKYEYPEKLQYTIEDLTKVCQALKEYKDKNRNRRMDIKALENKIDNLDRKIENATVYIKEIEKHKKSIFDFWKYTNKDEVPYLVEGYDDEENSKKEKAKKVFNYEDDINVLGKIVDEKQKQLLSKIECDAAFAVREDTETINILRQEDILKINKTYINDNIENLKEEYKDNLELIDKKDFDIFGSLSEDKTKIKVLNNQKHREIEKDKYKVLGIKLKTDYETYTENFKHYLDIFTEAYPKIKSPYDISVYRVASFMDETRIEVFDINPKKVLDADKIESNKITMFRVNVPEGTNALFYSNIMFFDNYNNTLPSGMDMSTQVALDLNRFSFDKIKRDDFKVNYEIDEYTYGIKNVTLLEYNLVPKREDDNKEIESDDNKEEKDEIAENENQELENENSNDIEKDEKTEAVDSKKSDENINEDADEEIVEEVSEDVDSKDNKKHRFGRKVKKEKSKKTEKDDTEEDDSFKEIAKKLKKEIELEENDTDVKQKNSDDDIVEVDKIEEMEGIEIKNPNQKEEEKLKIKEMLKTINQK